MSGRRESNPVLTNPNRSYYRYTTARDEVKNSMIAILAPKSGDENLFTARYGARIANLFAIRSVVTRPKAYLRPVRRKNNTSLLVFVLSGAR